MAQAVSLIRYRNKMGEKSTHTAQEAEDDKMRENGTRSKNDVVCCILIASLIVAHKVIPQ